MVTKNRYDKKSVPSVTPGTDFCIFYILFLVKGELFALLDPFAIFRGGAEDNVARRVDGGLKRILNNADNKSNVNHLHLNVLTNAKQRASHGDKKQRAARNTRSTTSAKGCNKA